MTVQLALELIKINIYKIILKLFLYFLKNFELCYF